jgi:hypothetical protein
VAIPERQLLARGGSRPSVCSSEEQQTFQERKGSAENDPACVKTRTGPISTNYLYNFSLIYRGIPGQSSLARHKIAPPNDTSAFLHNQDPKLPFVRHWGFCAAMPSLLFGVAVRYCSHASSTFLRFDVAAREAPLGVECVGQRSLGPLGWPTRSDLGNPFRIGGLQVSATLEDLERVFLIGQTQGGRFVSPPDGDLRRDCLPGRPVSRLPREVVTDGTFTGTVALTSVA